MQDAGMWLANDGAVVSLLPHRAQQQLYAYWSGKRKNGLLPGRHDIDPLDFHRLLPNVALIDVHRASGRLRFRFRVHGTALVERAGRDLTGLWFEEAFEPAEIRADLQVYEEVVERGVPYCSRRRIPVPRRDHVVYHRLLLPLAADGVRVDKILLLVVFE
jgi:hypothetical protein